MGEKTREPRIPLHPLEQILNQHYEGQISTEAIILLREVLEEIAHQMAEEAVEKHRELNKNREKQGLRRLRRLNREDVRNSYYNLDFKYNKFIFNQGSRPEKISNPGSDNVSANATAKPGNKSTDDRDREVA